MKISILAPNLSRNNLVRTYPIAKVLQRRYEVEVIGPILGSQIFPPFLDLLPFKPVHPSKVRFPEYFSTMKKLMKEISGDVIYAFKPRLSSFGVGLLAKLFTKRPLVLDIEDLDSDYFTSKSFAWKLHQSLRYPHSPLTGTYDCVMEKMVPLADQRIVVSEFLQKRYGGTRLYHGTDCELFDPTKFDPEILKDKWGLSNKKVILFAGTLGPHKGVRELIQAVKRLGAPQIQVLMVGAVTVGKELEMKLFRDFAGETLKFLGGKSHRLMPEFLALSDLVVLPQRDTIYANAQVPGKVFEAMAMAKPIIATPVSDLPEILSGCALFIDKSEPGCIAEGIETIFENNDAATEMGWMARRKCQENYSWDAMEKILFPIFNRYTS